MEKEQMLKLAERVEAGWDYQTDPDDGMLFDIAGALTNGTCDAGWVGSVERAIRSLDAAKALHDFMLPGWNYELTCHNVISGNEKGKTAFWIHIGKDLYDKDSLDVHYGEAYNPAAAWVAAILRAKAGEKD